MNSNDNNKIGCVKCGAEKTMVTLNGENYCAHCYNLIELGRHGIKEDFTHPELMMVSEADGTMHSFTVSHLVYDNVVHWYADEIGGGLHAEHVSFIRAETKKMLDSFYKKLKQTVLTKSVDKRPAGKDFISDELYRDDKYYSLKDRGTIQICMLDEYSIGFMVDGEKFTPDEFALMCGSFANWNMLYQMHEVSDGPLNNDEVLVRWRMTKKLMVQELKDLLRTVVNIWNHIPAGKQKQFELGFMTICFELRQYSRCAFYEAEQAADEMRDILKDVTSDEKEYPEKYLDMIGGATAPWEWDD